MKITEYQTVSEDSGCFDACVNGLLKDGYQPFGGPYAAASMQFCQAMVKVAPPTETKGRWLWLDMNETQKERAKWAAIGAVVAILVGLIAGGHYDLKPDPQSGLAWRLDRWTGAVETFLPNGQPAIQNH